MTVSRSELFGKSLYFAWHGLRTVQSWEDDATMATSWDREMQERFDRLETRFDGVETKVGGLETRFDDFSAQVAAVETRLGNKIDVGMDEVRELNKRAAEGYGVTLQSISSQLTQVLTALDTKWSDHDMVLRDHGQRIAALEQPGPR